MLEALAAVVKALLYAGILSCAGAVFAEATLRNPGRTTLRTSPDISSVATQIMCHGALLTLFAAVASALILFFRLGGQWDETTLSAVFSSSCGAATCLQLAGAGLLLASAGDPSAHAIRLSNAALVTLSFAFNGHAAAADLDDGLVVFLHVSAAAWWVGSLWLLRAACARLEFVAVAGFVRRFSVIATGLIGGLVIAGLILVLVLVEFARLPALSSYEQILGVKLGIVVSVLGVASYNKFRLTPRLAVGDSAAAASLRRMIGAELVLIGAILATTAILTTYTSPYE